LPYALTTGVISIVFGYSLVSYLPVGVAILLGVAAAFVAVKLWGRKP
jgi:hypothetical protein